MLKQIILKIELFTGQAIDWISDFLETKMFTIEKNAVTLGAVLGGIIVLMLGQYMIRKFAQQIEKRILSQLDIEPAIRHSLRTFIFYVLLVFLVLLVLRLLHIPLTAITIVGGGLAVAIGLGAQSIVYDFLSGLIIMLEHPIRQGDVVELENVRGNVEHIGARATRIHTVDNKHLIIPITFF